MRAVWERLKQRKLVQWSLAYLAGAWLLIQVFGELRDTFALPPAIGHGLTVLLGVGFLAALVLAWYHGEKGAQRATGPELLMLAALLVLAGAAVRFVAPREGPPDSASRPPPEAVVAPDRTQPPERGSIAVLPFVNMSPEAENEYFSDGMTEELLNTLSRVPGLRVAARTSSFQFKDGSADVREIGRTLGVASIVEGSVRRAGDRLRITAQLVDVADGYHRWSETYDRELRDVFAIQEELAQAIVAALRIELGTGIRDRLGVAGTEDLGAYELYLQGRHFWYRRTEEGFRKAIELFERALAMDPTYARADAGIADAYSLLAAYGFVPPDEGFPPAEAAARKALDMDSSLAEAHTSLAFVHDVYRWDPAAAEREFRRAIELNPNLAAARHWYAILLAFQRRFDEAIVQSDRALILDPLGLIIRADAGIVRLLAGRPGEAAELYRQVLELDPGFWVGHYGLGLVALASGRTGDAIEAFDRAVALGARSDVLAALGYAHARAGHEDKARRILSELVLRSRTTFVPASDLATVHVGLGELDRAIERLEEAFERREIHIVDMHLWPLYRPLWDDPRFQRLAARAGYDPRAAEGP